MERTANKMGPEVKQACLSGKPACTCWKELKIIVKDDFKPTSQILRILEQELEKKRGWGAE